MLKVADYIGTFLKKNIEQLINIHDAGKEHNGDGCLMMLCSLNNNKMDVFYMGCDDIKEKSELYMIILKEKKKRSF